ncbi:MAG: DUF6371 domain-containing protein [Chitinophagaceae bacterium]|mgnify:CR=1 FL=1
MVKEYRYSLERGSKKHRCPDCGKKTFVRYIDTETGDYLPDQYGRCDRENKCSYHLNPYKDGYSKAVFEKERGDYSGKWKPQRPIARIKAASKHEPVFIPFDVFAQTRQGYEQNIFIQNLLSRVPFPFEVKAIEQVVSQYNLGTVRNDYRAGAITFPFIDKDGNVRAIQVKQFDETNHTTGTDFLHSIIEKHHTRNNKPLPEWLEAYNKNEIKVSCLFGEHLLSKYHSNPVVLVEAPKTAVYGWLYFNKSNTFLKDCIWLAVYNKSSFSFDKLKVLQGRFIYVFPDLSKDGSTFREWETKAKEYEGHLPGTSFIFSDLLEQLAPEQDKSEGKDLADYLIKLDWRKFRKTETIKPQKSEKGEKSEAPKQTYFLPPETLPKVEALKPKPENWEQDIAELENYFASIKLPTQPIKLDQCSTITNCSLFIESHIATLKLYNGNKTFLPYLERLKLLQTTIKNQYYAI